MVRGWKSNAGWCFPRGKINSEESEEACAIREVSWRLHVSTMLHQHPQAFLNCLHTLPSACVKASLLPLDLSLFVWAFLRKYGLMVKVHEETGFDLTGWINTKDKISTQISAQNVTMFVVMGIDENTQFETQTRNEIGVSRLISVMALLSRWCYVSLVCHRSD